MRRAVLVVLGLVAAWAVAAAPGVADADDEDVAPDDQIDRVDRAARIAEEIGKGSTASAWWDSERHQIVVGVTGKVPPGQVRKRLREAGLADAEVRTVKHSHTRRTS